jgi:hypothetical protein
VGDRRVDDAVELVTAKLRENRATTDRRQPDEVIAEVISGERASDVLDELAGLAASLLQVVVGAETFGGLDFAGMNAEEALHVFTARFGQPDQAAP